MKEREENFSSGEVKKVFFVRLRGLISPSHFARYIKKEKSFAGRLKRRPLSRVTRRTTQVAGCKQSPTRRTGE